jgi:hypothetical protein
VHRHDLCQPEVGNLGDVTRTALSTEDSGERADFKLNSEILRSKSIAETSAATLMVL